MSLQVDDMLTVGHDRRNANTVPSCTVNPAILHAYLPKCCSMEDRDDGFTLMICVDRSMRILPNSAVTVVPPASSSTEESAGRPLHFIMQAASRRHLQATCGRQAE